MMKRSLLFFVGVFLALCSCSKDVDLYADYRVVPVIYGLLDAKADTNYIKITRAFYAQGDATQIAMNPDSSNYPGRLDVRLAEFCNGELTREIIFDTITISNKQPGAFYAPKQKLYYTAEKLRQNTANSKYDYQLTIRFPDQTIVSHTHLVGSGSFRVLSLAVNFSMEYFGTRRPLEFMPATSASSYDVFMAFTFKEQRAPGLDSIPRTMSWKIGTYDEYFLSTHLEDDHYKVTYRPEEFYDMLRSFLGADTTVPGLKRYIGDYPVEITVSAAGEELTQYIHYNSLDNNLVSGDNDFSLIDGGYGVFSSRMTATRKVRLAGTTIPDLVSLNWGFKFIGGAKD